MAWFQDPISQAFNPPIEPGVDVATPFHTPITALNPGKVVAVSYGGFGARVNVQTAPDTIQYYQHLDTIAPSLHTGSPVTAGEELGLSGGQLSGGSRPNSPQNSTGPHVEFGIVQSGHAVDPAATLRAGIGSGTPPADNSGGSGLVNINVPDPVATLPAWVDTSVASITQAAKDNIIPLVVAGL